jgi:hypothetical protein
MNGHRGQDGFRQGNGARSKVCEGIHSMRLNDVADLLVERLRALGFNAGVIIGSERAWHLKLSVWNKYHLGDVKLIVDTPGSLKLGLDEIRTAAVRTQIENDLNPFLAALQTRKSGSADSNDTRALQQPVSNNE